MRMVVSSAAVALSTALLLASPAAAQPRNCLAYRDLEQLHAVDNRSAVATTRRDAYMINFRNYCPAMSSGAFFILDDRFHGICVTPGDRMELSEPVPPCIVASVTHLRSIRLQNGR